MSRPSSITRLPAEVRDAADAAIREGRTIDEITAAIRSLGGDASRSSVGRYKQRMEEKLQRYREAQEVAGVWVTQLGAEPEGKVGRLLAEMLKTVAFKTLADIGEEDVSVGGQEIMFLARAIKDLESAGKLSAEREIRIRRDLAALVEKAVRTVEDGLASAPVSDPATVLKRIREEVYGIFA